MTLLLPVTLQTGMVQTNGSCKFMKKQAVSGNKTGCASGWIFSASLQAEKNR
jgi:hypothetical protein